MVIGGVLGGVLGAQVGHGTGRTAATIIGAMLGGAIGGNVGHTMDDRDRSHTALALEHVNTGVPSQWRNPDTGASYTVVPTRTYETAQGPCREYTMDAVVNGKAERVYGNACRESDGSWHAQR
ncbi:MAG TPA: RT0821/Lpp0805 family surface protein [Burkholderiales bacterium]|nr:RT0821/Lpp0805 family surface protein [Burkholderiales bacterium]